MLALLDQSLTSFFLLSSAAVSVLVAREKLLLIDGGSC